MIKNGKTLERNCAGSLEDNKIMLDLMHIDAAVENVSTMQHQPLTLKPISELHDKHIVTLTYENYYFSLDANCHSNWFTWF